MNLEYSHAKGDLDQPLLNITIGDQLEKTVELHPENPALIVEHQNIEWNYRQLNDKVNSLALSLKNLGIQAGDRVAIWGPNSYEWVLSQFATAKIGAILVCINPAYRLYELEYALNKASCKAIVLADEFKSSNYVSMLSELAPELSKGQDSLGSAKLPHLKFVIRMGKQKTVGMRNFDELLECSADNSDIRALGSALSPNDAINIQFTSGTTGSPKGATLSHNNILNNGHFVGASMELTAEDKLCIPVPLYHCFGMVMGNLACVSHGATMVYPNDGFDPKATLESVERRKCTALHGVPTMFIAALDEADRYDLSSLRTGIMAGAPCPEEVMKKVMDEMHMKNVLIAYGQTELSPVNHITSRDDSLIRRISTVGKPGPHLEVKIVDENGNTVAIDQKGEICTKGYSVMHGYWDDPEKTAETIDQEGWLHSGDIGVMDSSGYVKIVGRIKDMIIRGGENIYPREIEEFLITNPDIEDVHVFGIPDEVMGEEVCAWVKLRDGAACNEDDIVDFCRGQITHFKIPTYISLVSDFPMTVTGKVQKFKMREIMVEKLKR